MLKVQVFGLQRSGTNYLHWVIQRDLDAEPVESAGWKHAFPWEKRTGLHGKHPQPDTIVETLNALRVRPVVVSKDLPHWLASIERNPKDYERGGGAVEADKAKAWVRFHQEWSAYAPIVRYEDFVADFSGALDRLARLLDVRVTARKQPKKVPNSPRWHPDHKRRYL